MKSRWFAALTAVVIVAMPAPARATDESIPRCTGEWERVAAPLPQPNQVQGLGALGLDDVWVVGTDWSTDDGDAFALHWDGSAWTETLNGSQTVGRKTDAEIVLPVGPEDVWMEMWAGATTLGHWNGSSWSSVRVPRPYDNTIYGMDASGPDDVWAVGGRALPDSGGVYVDHPMTMHWDGTVWKVVPNAVPQTGILSDVEVLAADDAWAVGWGGGHDDPIIEHWDGVQWSTVDSAPSPVHGRLWSVDSFGPNDVWAVGGGPGQAFGRTVIQHWDGSSWRRVFPAHDAVWSEITDITIGGPGDGWMVVNDFRHEAQATIVNRFRRGEWRSQLGPRGMSLSMLSSPQPGLVWGIGEPNRFIVVRCRPGFGQPTSGMPGSASG